MSKLINKNIIRAMTIDISAIMIFGSVNFAAFVGEGDDLTNSEF